MEDYDKYGKYAELVKKAKCKEGDRQPFEREKWVTPAGGIIIKDKDGNIIVGEEKQQ